MSASDEKVLRSIRMGELLTVEFKSEIKRQLSNREIYENVVCLTNADGGILLLGVEDDGTVTGARPRHDTETVPHLLEAAVRNNTMPPIEVKVGLHEIYKQEIISIEVNSGREVYASRDGKCTRRVLGADGPECIPWYPYQYVSHLGNIGAADYTARIVEDTNWSDFDPLEIERLRNILKLRGGDSALVELDDRSLTQALRLVESRNGELVPNIAGVLLLCREEVLQKVVPTCVIAYQVLDTEGEVLVNDWFYSPLLKTLEAIEARFVARNQEREVQEGLFRIPIPDYSPETFREAVNNAVLHRDYTLQGGVHIQFSPDQLFISNPGGFLEGINEDNILVHEPKPRNPRLAEAFRRIGLVETTGRGVDRIYQGQLRYGRPLPDYSRSDRNGVRLTLIGGEASLAFAAFVYRQDREGNPLSLDEMLALNHLQYERRADSQTVGRVIQKSSARARSVMERLVERGLIEARGERGGRSYLLNSAVYQQLGELAGYVRASGFDKIRQESMIIQYLEAYERITRKEAAELCSLSGDQASRLLRGMANEGKLKQHGTKRGAFYTSK